MFNLNKTIKANVSPASYIAASGVEPLTMSLRRVLQLDSPVSSFQHPSNDPVISVGTRYHLRSTTAHLRSSQLLELPVFFFQGLLLKTLGKTERQTIVGR